MWCSDFQREENYKEYLRLLQDNDYSDVTYDEESGGVSAVHKQHKFSKNKGTDGVRQGDYELNVIETLRKHGHRVVLGAESNTPGIKSYDGFLDDIPMEIKTVEGDGTWSICTKLRNADKQRAKCVVLYFPYEELYSPFRIREGIRLFHTGMDVNHVPELSTVLTVVQNHLEMEGDKKATPIEGWSI